MSLLNQIEAAGIVGCGGAGFPTHVKLKGTFEYLILNGAECEPLLRNDRWLMRNKADEIVEATAAVARELAIPHAVIALKGHYHEEVQALKAAISRQQAAVEVFELGSFYPAGDEQTIVCEVTGRVVPPAGLPAQVGAVVDNVATIYAVWEAMRGIPLTHKYLTVTGEVKTPTILHVPVGTSLRTCIELAGGAKLRDYLVVTGGPMMGKPVPAEELDQAVVTKTTSGILVLPADGSYAGSRISDTRRMLRQARAACIQCSHCTQLCPRYLLGHPLEPHRIMRKMASGIDPKEMLDDPVIRTAQLCCECGICETYACPMGLEPRKINAMLKRELGAAGIRYPKSEETYTPRPLRDIRKVPAEKVAYRVGVHKYYNYEIRDLIAEEPDRVELPLQMHIGAPAVAAVRVGDCVKQGDVIAHPAEGKLGAVIHASIGGRIAEVGSRITIVKE